MDSSSAVILRLQLLESFVGLELRIVLGHREQPAHAGAQLLLGRADGGDVAGRRSPD